MGELPKITEIRVKLTRDPRNKLRGYCSVTFADAFVVRDLKIIDGAKGPFVAMPSRKLSDRCPRCSGKNHLRAKFCNNCGKELDPDRALRGGDSRPRLHADLAHPINSACRIVLHRAIVAALAEEEERAKNDGYVAPSFDDLDELGDADDDYVTELIRRREEREKHRGEGSGGVAHAAE